MATAATIKKNIAKLEAALKSKATPKSLKSKLETQLVKSKAELSGLKKGTKPKTSSTKSAQSALKSLKDLVNKNKKYKNYKGAGVDLERDADRPAKPIGRRTAKASGKTYYEYRANRIDVKQPPKRYPKLADGGYMANGGMSQDVNIKVGDWFYDTKNQLNIEVTTLYPNNKVVLKSIDYNKNGEKREFDMPLHILKSKVKGGSYFKIPKSNLKKEQGGYMAKGGMSQGYDDREDERLGMEHGKMSTKDLHSTHARRDDARFEERGKMAKGGSLSSIKEEYEENEDNNAHSENVVLLAKHFGTKEDLAEAKRILALHEKEGHLTSENGKKRQELHLKLIAKARTAMGKDGIEFAKGGLTEHGLKIGDKITTDMFWDNKIVVENQKTHKRAEINLETGERKEEMGKGGYFAEGGISEKEVVESNAEMVLSQIKAVKHHAMELSNVVSKNSDIEAWVVAKIERASTDLSDITHYLEYQTKKMAMGGEIHRTQE